MMEPTKRILAVDDEETLCEALRFNLEAEGYSVDTACSAEEALTLDLARYDLFLLDIMMGEISGMQLARILKSNPATASRPVIFCTARDAEEELIAGLDLGADDYITKPYSLKTVSARIRAVLRRSAAAAAASAAASASAGPGAAGAAGAAGVSPASALELAYLGLKIDPAKKMCTVDGREVNLPRKEFEILSKLLSAKGRIFSRAELLKGIWTDDVVVLDRVVDVNITRIRQKIGPYGKHIVTRSGYGYGFME